MAVNSDSYIKHKHKTQTLQSDAEFFDVKPDGAYSNQRALNCQTKN